MAASTTCGGRPRAPVRAVRADRDGVELRCAGHSGSPRAGQWSSPAPPISRRSRKAEAPRDLSALPAAGPFRERMPRRTSRNGGMRQCRHSAIPTPWLAIIGLAPGKHGANRTGRPFTGDFAGDLLYATLLKFGLAEGEYRADPVRRAAAEGRRYPQCSQMPAARQQAGTGRNRDVPKLFRGCAGRSAECPGAGRPWARSLTSLQRERWRARHVRSATAPKSQRPMAECCCRAITALATTRTPDGSTAAMFESVFERAVALKGEGYGGRAESLHIHEPLKATVRAAQLRSPADALRRSVRNRDHLARAGVEAA